MRFSTVPRKRTERGDAATTAEEQQHPLYSDQGTTTFQDAVVLALANVAAQEIEGVHLSHGGTRLPGDSSPAVGEFLGNVTGGMTRSRGIGERQVAVDLTLDVTYGQPIARVTQAVRRNVIERVENF